MSGRDFEKMRRQRNVSERGFEDVAGSDLIPAPLKKRRKSKAEARTEVAKALSSATMMTKLTVCPHGHRRKLRIPLSQAAGPHLCSQCGEVAR